MRMSSLASSMFAALPSIPSHASTRPSFLGSSRSLIQKVTPSSVGREAGGLSIGGVGDLAATGVGIAEFDDRLIQSEFDCLLAGQGSLTPFWSRLPGIPDRIILNVIEPEGAIFGARLFHRKHPIPEPSTALLLGMGLVVMAGAIKA